MTLLAFLTARPTIIGLAVLGALLATAGNVLLRGDAATKPAVGPVLARRLLWLGYAITAVSIVLFIVAGFLSGR